MLKAVETVSVPTGSRCSPFTTAPTEVAGQSDGQPTCVIAPRPGTLLPKDGDRSAIVSRAVSIQAISTGNTPMPQGTIKKLTDKGFGFIKTESGKDLFFHSSALQGVGFEELSEGQKVSYTEGQGPKGPRAEIVTPM